MKSKFIKNRFVKVLTAMGLAVVVAIGSVATPLTTQARSLTTEKGHPIHFERYTTPYFALYIAFTNSQGYFPLTDERMDEIRHIVAENLKLLRSVETDFWVVWLPESYTVAFSTYPPLELALQRPPKAERSYIYPSYYTVETTYQYTQNSTPLPSTPLQYDGENVYKSHKNNCYSISTIKWIRSDRQLVSTAGELSTEALNYFGTMQGLFTNEQLLNMIYHAPTRQDTRSSLVSPAYRSFADEELAYWINEYHALGGLNDFELEVLRSINEVRAYYGLHPVAISLEMSMAARLHSQEMADLTYFAHRSPNNGVSSNRGRMFGANVWGENITGRGFSVRCTEGIAGWLNSPGHRNMLLHSGITVVGIGTVLDGGTTFKFGCSDELQAIVRRSDMECITIRNPRTLGFCHIYGWVGEELIEARR